MPSKKMEIGQLAELGNSDKFIIKKSLPLFALWHSDLSIDEFKILDSYLSRINGTTDKKVIFSKADLEEILEIDELDTDKLNVSLEKLTKSIKIPNPDEEGSYKIVPLFDEITVSNTKQGDFALQMESSKKAIKYLFNTDGIKYLQYALRCVITLSSKYSYMLFIYLEHNKHRKCWEISIDDLRKELNCDTISYQNFKYFNRDILKKAHSEINTKTDFKYEYKTIREGNFVTGIRFEIINNDSSDMAEFDSSQIKGQRTMQEWINEENL